ncbi:MAG: DnaB-like helicase C-terminal domain-containing protein [Nanoarchaeota archaeon]|nr:DnaB-like helicase C-terminal domain-containing protein [Nanoarchaeota archaeon]
MQCKNQTIQEHTHQFFSIVKKRRERDRPEFPTGFKCIDDVTDGLHRGEVWVIAGKTGGGKTTLSLQIAKRISDNPSHSVLFLSLEMKGWELVARMFCSMFGFEYVKVMKGILPDDYIQKKEHFEEYLNSIDFEIFEYGYSWTEVESIIRNAYKSKKPDVIFIDFIQLVEWKGFGNQRLALMEYIRKLKELAKTLDIAIVVVSQLRRPPSGADVNRPPDIVDLMGSGSIEQTSDKVIIVIKKIEGQGESENITYYFKLAKNRQGETMFKEVWFQGQYYRFTEDIPREVQDILNITGGTLA